MSAYSEAPASKVTVPFIQRHKVRIDGLKPLTMVTAYDAPSARVVDESGAEMILVGDSLAMVVLGYKDTLSVTTEDMAYHTAAVRRTEPKALVVSDLPWMSYHVSVEDTLNNAAKLIRAGAEAVKLEGGSKRVHMVEALVEAEIPVQGHIGLTPQSVKVMGGFLVQGRTEEAAQTLLLDAKRLESAGAFSLVLEGVPDVVAKLVTEQLDIPTIGIGAGPSTDGQVLVFHDLLGYGFGRIPKFVRKYSEFASQGIDAVTQFVADVRSGEFPSQAESYTDSKGLLTSWSERNGQADFEQPYLVG